MAEEGKWILLERRLLKHKTNRGNTFRKVQKKIYTRQRSRVQGRICRWRNAVPLVSDFSAFQVGGQMVENRAASFFLSVP